MVSSFLVILSQLPEINDDDVSGFFLARINFRSKIFLVAKIFSLMLMFGKMLFSLLLLKTYKQGKQQSCFEAIFSHIRCLNLLPLATGKTGLAIGVGCAPA
jgi:hypothetical protein